MDSIVYEIAGGIISFWFGWWLGAKYDPIKRIRRWLGYWLHRCNDKFHTPGKVTKRYKFVDKLATRLYR